MWNTPSQKELAQLPRFYTNSEKSAEDIVIHMHFFFGASDWYVAEFDGEDTFFGYVNLGNPDYAEWGNFSLTELKEIKVNSFEIDRDLHWRIRKFSEINQS